MALRNASPADQDWLRVIASDRYLPLLEPWPDSPSCAVAAGSLPTSTAEGEKSLAPGPPGLIARHIPGRHGGGANETTTDPGQWFKLVSTVPEPSSGQLGLATGVGLALRRGR